MKALTSYKELILYFIPYLTLCGALYHMTFWERFDINGLSFISLSDILKSSVYPIYSILFAVLYNLTIQNFVLGPKQQFGKPVVETWSNYKVMLIYFSLLITLMTVLYLTNSLNDPSNYILYGTLHGLFATILLFNNGFLVEALPYKIRKFVIDLLVFIPLVSYYTGKYRSEQIYQNIKYKFTVSGNDTLKFIGNTEKHFVFTDLKNQKILFLLSDKLDTVTLYERK